MISSPPSATCMIAAAAMQGFPAAVRVAARSISVLSSAPQNVITPAITTAAAAAAAAAPATITTATSRLVRRSRGFASVLAAPTLQIPLASSSLSSLYRGIHMDSNVAASTTTATPSKNKSSKKVQQRASSSSSSSGGSSGGGGGGGSNGVHEDEVDRYGGGRGAANTFTAVDLKCQSSDSASVTAAIKERAHATLEVDLPSVVKALHDDKQGTVTKECPFLHRVSDSLSSDTEVMEIVRAGGPEAASAMTDIINTSLWSVLRDLKERRAYREFRYFRRVVGSHPQVALPELGGRDVVGHPNNATGAAAAAQCSNGSSSSSSSSSRRRRRSSRRAGGEEEEFAQNLGLNVTPAASQQNTDVAATIMSSSASASAAAAAADSAARSSSPPPAEQTHQHHHQHGQKDRQIVNWCSNDYLNMSHNPAVIEATIAAVREQGAGCGGTRNISGSNVLHAELEAELAQLSGTSGALLFNSCYTANLAIMQALGKALPSDTIVFSDEENHASLIQGIRFSGLPKRIFRHNDTAHLESLMAAEPANTTKIVVFESVYSMSGTMAPVAEMLELCERYDAFSLIDEVHAVGLYGEGAGGVLDELGMLGRATAVTGTLGKAFGVAGGWVAGSAQLIDVVRSLAPSFIFTTAVPPATCAGALASVRHVRSCTMGADERHGAKTLARHLSRTLQERGVPLTSVQTHILPVRIGDPELCRTIAAELLEQGIYVQPINYPSVPHGHDMLRFTVGPKHTEEQCADMVEALCTSLSRHNLLLEQADEEGGAGGGVAL